MKHNGYTHPDAVRAFRAAQRARADWRRAVLRDVIFHLVWLALLGAGLFAIHGCSTPAPPPCESCDCHAEETVTVVCERRLEECLDTLRLAARVVARYEEGVNICDPAPLFEGDLDG